MRVSVAGASGYGGGELLRLLRGHPEVETVHLAAGERAGEEVGRVWPALRGLVEARLVPLEPKRLAADSDLVFLALPEGPALRAAGELRRAGARVVDLGGSLRLEDAGLRRRWYGAAAADAAIAGEAVYGLPEWWREEISGARLVANPGCYPTAAALGLLPLAEEGWIAGEVIVDAKSGLSGAGRGATLRTSFAEANESVAGYAVLDHRHAPELEQALGVVARRAEVAGGETARGEETAGASRGGDEIGGSEGEAGPGDGSAGPRVHFVPHLVPMTRGLLTTCYVPLADRRDREEVLALLRARYAEEPFVRVTDGSPGTGATAGSNFCDLGAAVDGRGRLAVVSTALDNLGKGAAGQAIQNMNLMLGLEERSGLWTAPIFP